MVERQYRQKTKVLYIGGTGRTGSTLLTRLLGEVPGWFPGGELAFLWRYGLVEAGRCSCGDPLAACPTWSAVFADAAENGATIDGERMVQLRRRCWSVHLPLMASRRMANRLMDRLEEFPTTVEQVYQSLAAETGSRVIIDSSKEPHYSWVLRERTDLDVYFLQLVRDPRAVAYSWTRVRPERGLGGSREMERRGPVRSAVYFDVSNLAAELIWNARPDRFRLMRYEDFTENPQGALDAISSFVDEPIRRSPLEGSTFATTGQHMAWGNPGRFEEGVLTIRDDDAWRDSYGSARSLISRLSTAPLAGRYGYPLRPTSRRGQVASGRLERSRILGGTDHA